MQVGPIDRSDIHFGNSYTNKTERHNSLYSCITAVFQRIMNFLKWVFCCGTTEVKEKPRSIVVPSVVQVPAAPIEFSLALLEAIEPEDEDKYIGMARQQLESKRIKANELLHGKPLLSIAVRNGLLKFVKLFLEFGANANEIEGRSLLSYTPFTRALEKIHFSQDKQDRQLFVEIAKALLERGANPDACRINTPALHIAIESKEEGFLQALLEKGANIHFRDSLKNTPLNYLLFKYLGSPVTERAVLLRMAQTLIKNGADVNSADQKPAFLFHVIGCKWYALASWVINNCPDVDLKVKNILGETLFKCLIDKMIRKDTLDRPEQLSLLQLLIDKGVDLNSNGALDLVIICGMKDVLAMMLKSKRVEIKDASRSIAKSVADKHPDKPECREIHEMLLKA